MSAVHARRGSGRDRESRKSTHGSVMTLDSALAVGSAFAVSLVLPAVVLPLLRRAHMVDVPNERSAHTAPTVRGGGIAPAVGLAVGLAIAASVASSTQARLLWLLLGVGLTTACLGLVEDVRGVPKVLRALGQFGIGVAGGAMASQVLDVSVAWAVVGGLAFLCGVNAVNFMDGVNGISALHGMIAGGAYIALGVMRDVHWLTVGGSVLAVVFAAFLVWNATGHVFLGDVGSYLLGAVVAMIILLGWMQGLPILALAAPMAVYVADTGLTLVTRVAKGEEWHEAHRDHIYQRLQRRGLAHLTVAGLVALASAACASLGLVAVSQQGGGRAAAWAGLVLVVAAYAALRALDAPDPAHEEARGHR